VTDPATIPRAQRVLEHGYPPVLVLKADAPTMIEKDGKPVKQSPGKQPHGRLWARKEREVYGATARKVAGWANLWDIADYPGLGIACGKAAACDVDVYDYAMAAVIEVVAADHLGETRLRRVGEAPKCLLVYRSAGEPIRKAQTPEMWKGDLKAKVEVLGQGQQFVAFGIHPATKAPFIWGDGTPETVPLADLPAITQEQVDAFIAEAEQILRRDGYRAKAEIEAASSPVPAPQRPARGRKVEAGADPFRAVNAEAMKRLEAWVPALFPQAKRQASTGAWRVPSHVLGRKLEEDLSIAPGGIVDFGVHDQGDPRAGKRTPIDLVIEHGHAPDAKRAAQWLADQLGLQVEIKGRPRANGADPHPVEPSGVPLFDLSHDGLALDLGELWKDDGRHVALWGRWLFWTGSRWEMDERLLHMTRARAYLRRRADELVRAAEAGKIEGLEVDKAEAIAKGLRSAQTVAHVTGLARSNPDQASTVEVWDADPWKLNTPGGIVDLRTGKLCPADPLAYCTKSTAVAPAPKGTPTPLWDAFLARIFRHDPELISFMQRVLGYGLTGLTNEHVLIFAWGQGANGKGTLFNTASRIMGDYATVAPADMLLVTQSDRHSADMAMLRGARLVTAQELAPGRAWDEPKLKSLTGGDPITARFMRQDFFTYQPAFLLAVAGNHKPSFKGVDEAVRRRVKMVPFLQNITAEERDKDLPEKLKKEQAGILRWMIDGCLAWQKDGLNPPASVQEASEDYLSAEDVLGQWLGERCIIAKSIEFTAVGVLYADWREWCEKGGLPIGSIKAFSQILSERGITRKKGEKGNGFVGIGLLPKTWHRDETTAEPTAAAGGSGGSSIIDRKARAHTHTIRLISGKPPEPPGTAATPPRWLAPTATRRARPLTPRTASGSLTAAGITSPASWPRHERRRVTQGREVVGENIRAKRPALLDRQARWLAGFSIREQRQEELGRPDALPHVRRGAGQAQAR
jgi:putative DNA primase/helicase